MVKGSKKTYRIASLGLLIFAKTIPAQAPVPQWQDCLVNRKCPGDLTTVYSFSSKSPTAGYGPQSPLVLGDDGALYGTTTWGGDLSQNGGRGYGTVFKITRDGKLQTIHSFNSFTSGKNDGDNPTAGMIKASDGTLWGVAGQSVYRIATDGTYTSLGGLPVWAGTLNRLTQGSDGNFYGTSFTGGASIGDAGTFFRLTPDGSATLLHSFNGKDPIRPTAVVEGPDGYFYGMTANDGIFKISATGQLTVLAQPVTSVLYYPPSDGLVVGTDGNFYGIRNFPRLAVFKITADGEVTVLANLSDYGFSGDILASLVLSADGNFYDMTANGVFQITSGGEVTAVYAFLGKVTEVAGTMSTLVATADGLYGASGAGGQACATILEVDCTERSSGTIFKINTSGGAAGNNAGGTGSGTSSLDALDPNVEGLRSLLPLSYFAPNAWNDSAYQVFAASQHTVSALAADGVTPLVLRYRPPAAGGKVVFTIQESESGTLGCLDPTFCPPPALAPAPGNTTVTVNVQKLADGSPMAFALLQAPIDFVRAGAQVADTGAQTKKITITAQVMGATTTPTPSMTLTLWRPPVVLLHGLWSNACTWKWFLPGFIFYAQDYEATNSSRFAVNAFQPQKGIQHVLAGMRAPGIAVTQADFVGHSMGGLLARLYASDANPAVPYERPENLGYGDIHKLITLDTPHLGSELANALVDQNNNEQPLGTAFEAAVEAADFSSTFKACRPAASTANFLPPYCVNCGAVQDLSAGSDVLSQMPELKAPSHVIVGVGGSTALNDLDNFTTAMSLVGGPAGDIAEILGAVADWYQGEFFHNARHDLIVSEESQMGGLAGPTKVSTFDADPPDLYWSVHFTVTGEQWIADEVIRLLNAPTLSPSFESLPATSTLAPQQAPPRPGGQPDGRTGSRGILPGGVRIVSPRSGTAIRAGDLVFVTVEAAGGYAPARVLVVSAHNHVVVRQSPFAATLRIPADAKGDFDVVAFGIDEHGAMARSEPLRLRVEPRRPLQVLGR